MNSSIRTLFAFAAVATGVLAASCSKENAIVKEFTATMEQCTEQDSKTTLYNNTLYWQQGDQIKVYGSSGDNGIYTANNVGGATTFALTCGDPGSGSYTAIYPALAGNDDGTIELPAVQMSNDGSLTGFPMYSTSDNTDLNFMHLCGVLRLRLQKSGVSVSAIEITSDVELTGRHSITMSSGGVPSLTHVSYGDGNSHNSVMLICNTPQNISSSKDFYIYLPEYDYTSLRIRIYSIDGGVCTKTLNSGVTVAIHRGSIKTITMSSSLTFVPNAGRLDGLFSVSDTKKVYFSQGNLQYQASTNTWHFAENQYGYVGSANSNISSTYSGWIDLFGWGTSGWNSGAVCYQPWSTSNSWRHYYPGNSYTNGLTGAYAEADWAWHNAISNGGNAAHLWRTLTSAEWDYLLNTRTNASSKRGIGNINGVAGLILLPDSWTLPMGCPQFKSGTASSYNDWTLNSYTLAQWAEMETAGAVFLPAEGDRYGMIVYGMGDYGCYWSSTPGGLDDQVHLHAFSMFFRSSLALDIRYVNRNRGGSVRPVQDN